MTVTCILLGPERDSAGYACRCCGWRAPSLDAFAGPDCWPCAMGANPECPRCIDAGGVNINLFQSGGKSHRMVGRNEDGDARTACGRVIPWDRLGGAQPPVIEECKRCWRDDGAQAADQTAQ